MKLSYYSRLRYAQTVAKDAGLQLVEEKEDRARTDGRCIYIKKYNPLWDEDSWEEIEWWGKLIHETYHNDKRNTHHRHFEGLNKYGKGKSQLWKWITNAIEDHRIEFNSYGEYPGRDKHMEKLRGRMLSDLRKQVTVPSNAPKVDALFMLQYVCFGLWQKGCMADVLSYGWDPSSMGYFKAVEDLIPKIVDLKDDWEGTFKLADEIIERWRDEDEEQDKERGEGEGKPEDGEGEGEGKGDGGEGLIKKFILTEHGEEGGRPMPVAKDATMEHDDSLEKLAPVGVPMEDVKTKDQVGKGSGSAWPALSTVSGIMRHVTTAGLAAQIKRYLLVQIRNRQENGHRSGKLDGGSLWKASVYRGTRTGERVFNREREHRSIDTAVSLVVDSSGSMCGEKYEYAAAAACILNEVFAKIGTKVRVSGFTDLSATTINYEHKDFDERVASNALAERFVAAEEYVMAGNADGENVLYEYEKLVARKEQKKVMIVLSDGQPADSKHRYNSRWYLQQVVSEIESRNHVTIIGVGICTDAVRDYYSKCYEINDPIEVEQRLLEILQKEVLV